METRRRRALTWWLASSLLFTACGTVPPVGGDRPRPRPVERVDLAVLFQPRIEWEVKDERNLSADSMAGSNRAVAGCIGTGPFIGVCLAVVLPFALAVGAGVQAAARRRHERAPEIANDRPNGVRVIDLRELTDGFGLQRQLQRAIAGDSWRVVAASPASGSGAMGPKLLPERTLRLEVQVDNVKALSTAPIRNLWVHELQISWKLVDPQQSEPVDTGNLTYEKVLSFSLRYDEAAGRWIGKDDGRFAADWARACDEIADRIAERVVPAISTYSR